MRYLSEGFVVPLNVMFFRYFEDDGRAYVARTWLVDTDTATTPISANKKFTKSKEPWNGQDWYVSFGEFPDSRRWEDARGYGFVSAGGGEWFSRTLRSLPVAARIFVCIPKVGYVGVGHVLTEATSSTRRTCASTSRSGSWPSCLWRAATCTSRHPLPRHRTD